MTTEILETVETFDQLSTSQDVIATLKDALSTCGRDYFCLNLFPRSGQSFADAIVACELPPAWLDLYVRKGFVDFDPAVRHCKKVVLPFRYQHAPYDRESDPRAAEVVDRARDHGVCNGLLVPIPSPRGSIGDLWVAGSHDSADDRELAAIHMLGVSAFYKIQQLSHPPEGLPKASLTRREREVLTWVATGKTAWEIGEVLHISKRTVEWHLQQAAQKLGASNRMHAVIIAARDHLIEI